MAPQTSGGFLTRHQVVQLVAEVLHGVKYVTASSVFRVVQTSLVPIVGQAYFWSQHCKASYRLRIVLLPWWTHTFEGLELCLIVSRNLEGVDSNKELS